MSGEFRRLHLAPSWAAAMAWLAARPEPEAHGLRMTPAGAGEWRIRAATRSMMGPAVRTLPEPVPLDFAVRTILDLLRDSAHGAWRDVPVVLAGEGISDLLEAAESQWVARLGRPLPLFRLPPSTNLEEEQAEMRFLSSEHARPGRATTYLPLRDEQAALLRGGRELVLHREGRSLVLRLPSGMRVAEVGLLASPGEGRWELSVTGFSDSLDRHGHIMRTLVVEGDCEGVDLFNRSSPPGDGR